MNNILHNLAYLKDLFNLPLIALILTLIVVIILALMPGVKNFKMNLPKIFNIEVNK